jgi:hypothetical protein
VELAQGRVVRTGLEYDRQFTLAQRKKSENSHTWHFITQRSYPLLACVRTEIWVPDPSSPSYAPEADDVKNGGAIIVFFPYIAKGFWEHLTKFLAILRGIKLERSFRFPYNPTSETIEKNGYSLENMTIWRDSPLALNMSVHLPPELKVFVGVPNEIALFRVLEGQEREVFRCAPRKEELGRQPITGFADSVSNFLALSSSVSSN